MPDPWWAVALILSLGALLIDFGDEINEDEGAHQAKGCSVIALFVIATVAIVRMWLEFQY